MKRLRIAACAIATLLAAAITPSPAQTVSGHLFEDRDADGRLDPGEPPLAGVPIGLLGTPDAGGSYDQSMATADDGTFALSPGNGCYLLDLADPEGWRLSPGRADRFPESTPGYTFPVGRPRFSKLDQGAAHLRDGSLRYTAMGDSIAWNFNFCSYPESFWYSKQVRTRLACAAPAASVTLDQAAVKGEHTDDLLVNDNNNNNNVFRIIELQPALITLSMIGNDLLDVDVSGTPTQPLTNKAVAEVLDSRRNLQEAISALVSGVPGADIAINSLYDNLAFNCPSVATSAFHKAWLPIVDQILRDIAWGQTRRASVIEAAADFGQQGPAGDCSGFHGMICRDSFGFDRIHPNNNGYRIVREKAWEAVGGVNLGPKDPLLRTSVTDLDLGYLRRVRRIYPASWEARNGAAVLSPAAALSEADGGATASIQLGGGSEELRLAGFPDWYDEIQIVKVIAGVRYHTSGVVGDDFYRVEGSVSGQFTAPPGFAYSPTNWNFATAIVGGGGPNQPPEKPDYPAAKLLVFPDLATDREVSATLTKNPVLPAGATDYQWPPVTHEDLATTAIRVVAAPVAATAGNDNYAVELEAAWLDLYGWEKPRPPEVTGLQVEEQPSGDLDVSFLPLPAAQRYNLYFGRLASLCNGYDHGATAPAGPVCDAPTAPAGGGRLRILAAASQQPGESAYILVTAHVDGVESPAGTSSAGVEIDRSRSVCR